jgi:hypothetical protein
MDAGLPGAFRMTQLLKEFIVDGHLPSVSVKPIVSSELEEIRVAFRDKYMHLIDESLDIEAIVRRIAATEDSFISLMTELIAFLVPIWLRTPLPRSAGYLAGISSYAPRGKPLHVFTLNYDCALEWVLESAKIRFTTGFLPHWSPASFDEKIPSTTRVNIYKLHGSISWYPAVFRPDKPRSIPNRRTYEHYDKFHEIPVWRFEDPSERLGKENVIASLLVQRPLIVLADMNKVKLIPPFRELWNRLADVLERAKTLIAVGYSWRDEHVNEIVEHNSHLRVVNVSPTGGIAVTGENMFFTAKEAFAGTLLQGMLSQKLPRMLAPVPKRLI